MLMRYDPYRYAESWFGGRSRTPWMPMDAVRHADHVELRFDLPGVAPDTIEVAVERNVLTVQAARHWAPADEDQVLARERPQGTFRRQVVLGDTLDADRLEAHYDQGVLTLRVPVAEQAKPHKVEIQVGASPEALDVTASN
jgi:HSP20 family protein